LFADAAVALLFDGLFEANAQPADDPVDGSLAEADRDEGLEAPLLPFGSRFALAARRASRNGPPGDRAGDRGEEPECPALLTCFPVGSLAIGGP
jgi:hypothetical protein